MAAELGRSISFEVSLARRNRTVLMTTWGGALHVQLHRLVRPMFYYLRKEIKEIDRNSYILFSICRLRPQVKVKIICKETKVQRFIVSDICLKRWR